MAFPNPLSNVLGTNINPGFVRIEPAPKVQRTHKALGKRDKFIFNRFGKAKIGFTEPISA